MYVNLEGVNCYCSYCDAKLDLKDIIEKIKLEANRDNDIKEISISTKCNCCQKINLKNITYDIYKSVIFAEESHE